MDKNYTFRTVFDNYYEHKLACKLDPRFSFKIINSSKLQQHTPIFPQYGLFIPVFFMKHHSVCFSLIKS